MKQHIRHLLSSMGSKKHVVLAVLFFLVWVTALLSYLPPTWRFTTLLFTLLGPVLLLSVFLHSLGHCVASRAVSTYSDASVKCGCATFIAS